MSGRAVSCHFCSLIALFCGQDSEGGNGNTLWWPKNWACNKQRANPHLLCVCVCVCVCACVCVCVCGWVCVCATVPASQLSIYVSVYICLAPQPMAMGNLTRDPRTRHIESSDLHMPFKYA